MNTEIDKRAKSGGTGIEMLLSIPRGMIIGLPLGIALGVALENMILGIGTGFGVGIAIAAQATLGLGWLRQRRQG